MKPIRRILHPSDFSRASRPAFQHAVELAKDRRAELTILHVLSPVMPYVGEAYAAAPRVYADLLASLREEAKWELDKLVAQAKKAGVKATAVLLEGTAHDRIARAAKSRRADLVVIGTHGRTGLARLVLGSVASRVIASVSCPVLTVRGT